MSESGARAGTSSGALTAATGEIPERRHLAALGAPSDAPALRALHTAAATLEGIAVRTPLIEASRLSRQLGVPVFLKCEQWQPVGAFKVRGAWTAVTRLIEREGRPRGLIAHSSGNHGRAVAWVARRLELPAVIVMNDNAPPVKVEAVRAEGAEVVLVDRYLRVKAAEERARRDGLTMIPPFNHPDVILGQSTCTLEVLEEFPEASHLLVPIGGGGLLAGACAAAMALDHPVEPIGCEPAGAAKLSRALAEGHPVPLESTASIADGLLPVAVGELPWEPISRRVTRAFQVAEDSIGRAVGFLFREMGLKVEPSGAVGVAALLEGQLVPAGPVAVILSGGNVAPDLFAQLTVGPSVPLPAGPS